MAGRITALILATAAAMLGLVLIGVGLLRAIVGDHDAGQFLVSAAAVPGGIMLLELGLAAAWLAVRAGRGDIALEVTLPPWWASVLAFIMAIGAGWITLRAELWWLFPVFATVAIFAPVAAVGSLGLPDQGPRPSWRRLLPAFAWGAIVAPVLAISLQLLAVIGAIAAAVVGVMASGADHLETMRQVLQRLQGRTLTDSQAQALTQLAVQQPVVLAVGAFVLVFVGPVTEELSKFGATLICGRTRAGAAPLPTLTIFLIGLAAGLGFAATENIFYTAEAGAGGWTALALLRGVTPLMHGTASALFALGWARQRRDPGGWWLLWGALAAVGLHAAWNFCNALLIVAILCIPVGGTAAALASFLALLALGSLALLVLGSIITLLHLRRALEREAGLPDARPAPAPLPPPGPHRGGWTGLPEVRVQHVGETFAPATPATADRR